MARHEAHGRARVTGRQFEAKIVRILIECGVRRPRSAWSATDIATRLRGDGRRIIGNDMGREAAALVRQVRAACRRLESAGVLAARRDTCGKALGYYLATATAGVCRICGCTEDAACNLALSPEDDPVACSWADETRTLCTNPECLAKAGEGET